MMFDVLLRKECLDRKIPKDPELEAEKVQERESNESARMQLKKSARKMRHPS